MKKYLLLCLQVIAFSTVCSAQKLEKYFDYLWKPCDPASARFVALIQNTDSGWKREDFFIQERRLHMTGLFADSNCSSKNGVFYYYHANGIPESIGRYKANRKEGLWLSYYDNRFMKDSTLYELGRPVGTSFHWHNNGSVSDSTVYNTDGTGISASWFPNGIVSSAGRLVDVNLKNGKWKYYTQDGLLAATEVYDHDRLVDRQYFAEDGSLMKDNTDKTRPASFPGGPSQWVRFLENNLFFPLSFTFVNNDRATMIFEFTIDPDGNITNIELTNPFHPVFDDIALRAIKKSPKWLPAIDHNRTVPYVQTQSITYHQKN